MAYTIFLLNQQIDNLDQIQNKYIFILFFYMLEKKIKLLSIK